MLGVTGSDAWFTRACEVLAEGNFDQHHTNLLRAHDGADGDPTCATRFLPFPPSGDDWQKTLLHLTERRIHPGGCLWQEVPLGCPPSEGFPRITQHSAKLLVKPCVYAVARVHSCIVIWFGLARGPIEMALLLLLAAAAGGSDAPIGYLIQ